MNFGNNSPLFEMDLGQFGAKGFNYQERADFSGHRNGMVDPHVNGEVLGPWQNNVARDLTNNQFNGMNGMQGGGY